jgi:hypothetical protein
VEGRHDTEPLSVRKGSPRMPTKNAKTESGGFSAEEPAAMKERAAELRAEGKKGAKKADGLHPEHLVGPWERKWERSPGEHSLMGY